MLSRKLTSLVLLLSSSRVLNLFQFYKMLNLYVSEHFLVVSDCPESNVADVDFFHLPVALTRAVNGLPLCISFTLERSKTLVCLRILKGQGL
jgi:hypothetical protein